MKTIHFISLFVLLSIGFGCRNTEEKHRNVDSKYKLIEYSVFEHDMGQIIRITADDSCIYISNAPDYKIFVYDFKGNLKKTIGNKGPAPWEFGSIWSFAKEKDGKSYWVHDYSKQHIKKYSAKNDSLLISRRLKTTNNIQYLKDGKFLVPRVINKSRDFVISVYNAENNIFEKDFNLTTISGIESDLINKDYVLSGFFCKNSSNEIIYSCIYAGVFFHFNRSCDSVKIYKDIRNLPIPKSSISNNEIHLSPRQLVSICSAVDNSKIYLLTLKDETQNPMKCKIFYIDIYNLRNGKYIKSITLPLYRGEEIPVYMAKTKDYLIIGYINGTIAVYDFKGI
ncbi:MAG: 6-bladed beta-propeller [Bacteroidales bacterium]|nr:6-bladed beta-propeller [Bacteroidales bacterium]